MPKDNCRIEGPVKAGAARHAWGIGGFFAAIREVWEARGSFPSKDGKIKKRSHAYETAAKVSISMQDEQAKVEAFEGGAVDGTRALFTVPLGRCKNAYAKGAKNARKNADSVIVLNP